MPRHRVVAAVAAAVLLTTALSADAGLFDRRTRGDGELETVAFDLPECRRVTLRCGLDVHVTLGDRQSVQLTVDGNLVRLYDLEVRDGALVIDADGSPRPSRGAGLDLVLTSLDRLEVEGAGDIVIDDYRGDDLELVIDGAGDLDIDGEAGRLNVTVNGAGDIDARRLIAREVVVRVNGAGDVDVYASDTADVTINGVGDIDVYGDPAEFTRSVAGLGSIDRR